MLTKLRPYIYDYQWKSKQMSQKLGTPLKMLYIVEFEANKNQFIHEKYKVNVILTKFYLIYIGILVPLKGCSLQNCAIQRIPPVLYVRDSLNIQSS